MSGLTQTWAALTPFRRIVLIAAVAGTIALTLLMANMASKPRMALLYGGLDQRAAGQVLAQLDQMGLPTEVRGGAIYVPEADRDRARLSLAQEGLPQGGPKGYELLDSLSGFGTTAEMFDAAYWRAKEGELARTLLAADGVREARVHIGAVARRPFARDERSATASVTLRGAGGRISPQTALSARYLVALAVPGLDPAQVAVIDAVNGVVLRPGEQGEAAGAASEADRAERLKREIEALVAARTGEGRSRVSVFVETVRNSESITRRSIDPETRALRRNEATSVSESGSGAAGVTVASNLPDGDAAGEGPSSEREESRETNSYDYSETREERVSPAGGIARIGVAILLDSIRETAADGTVTETPRTAEEIAAIEALVKAAIGYDEARGDTVTIESMGFATPPVEGTAMLATDTPGFIETHMMQLMQLGALVLVILALGLFVVRPVLMAGRREAADDGLNMIDVTPPPGLSGMGAGMGGGMAGDTEGDMGGGMGGGMADLSDMAAAAGLPGASDSAEAAPTGDDAVAALRAAVDERREESADLLKSWLEEKPEAQR